MKKTYIITLITLLTLASCGKSKEELELEKTKIELEKVKFELAEKIQTEKQKQIEAKNNYLLKQHEQKVNVGKQKRQTELREALNQANLALQRAENNYNEINEFQIGRSQYTKDQQLGDARNQINKMSNYIKNVKTEIPELELSNTFDFQKKPEDVVKHLFLAAKNKDFSKLRYICDPYAENDSDTQGLCYTGILPQSDQDRFIKNFKNGRIIGKSITNGNEAEVEFAFGQSSNRLEKIKLINRMGNWYLESF